MARIMGKVIGTLLGAYILGGWGAAAGFLIGHANDLEREKRVKNASKLDTNDLFPDFVMPRAQRAVFAPSLIVLGAKLAKADGHVTRDEVMAFRRVFRVYDHHADMVGNLFDRARSTSEGYEPYAARMAQIFGRQSAILEEVLTGLFYIAIADSPRLSREEILFLRRVSVIFGFTEPEFVGIAGRVGIRLTTTAPPPKQHSAYDVLGLPTTATDDVIKRTYRALVRKHHPDKLLAAGLSQDQVAEATEKIKVINAAYAEICRLRDIK